MGFSLLQHLRIPFVNQGIDEVNHTMVNKTNVLEIQLNGTQSGCKFLDVKGFGQFILGPPLLICTDVQIETLQLFILSHQTK